MEDKTGGAAFGHGAENGHCCGMTLLDYFAAAALIGLCADSNVDQLVDKMAKFSYDLARAMLEEKRRGE